jgi:hypothetical protein
MSRIVIAIFMKLTEMCTLFNNQQSVYGDELSMKLTEIGSIPSNPT